MNPPIVYEVTKPRTHNTNKITAIVYSMHALLFLRVIERHPPAVCLDATAHCIFQVGRDGVRYRHGNFSAAGRLLGIRRSHQALGTRLGVRSRRAWGAG